MSDQCAGRNDPFRSFRRALLFAACVTLLLGGVVLITIGWWRGGQLMPIGRDELDAARARWAQVALSDYDLETEVSGRQGATYRTCVRGGRVIRASRDGQPLSGSRTLGTWSVPGMFLTIERDVENVERAGRGQVDPQIAGLELRGQFDPRTGLPRRYFRTQRGGRGEAGAVSWRVTVFEPQQAGKGS